MSIPDMDGPRVITEKIEDFNFPYEDGKYYGFFGLKVEDKIIVRKIFIDEIVSVVSSTRNEELYKLASISFLQEVKKGFFKSLINKEPEYKLVVLDAGYYSECFYSTFFPIDKIYLEDIGKTQQEAKELLNKRENSYSCNRAISILGG